MNLISCPIKMKCLIKQSNSTTWRIILIWEVYYMGNKNSGIKPKNITRKRFGKLTVSNYAGNSRWLCVCDCGNVVTVQTCKLNSGHTKSCGCLKHIGYHTTHGKRQTRLYRIWSGMKSRCNNTKHPRYSDWGGRGIKVCDEWLHDFEKFYTWSMSHGYADNLTIDRIDNDKGYSPDNCRWATVKEQNSNKRNVKKGVVV